MPEKRDPQLARLLQAEENRQRDTINLIASENYIPTWLREITASALTHKYAEGYPGKRYYAGCGYIDKIEQLAIQRCKKLFDAHHANVQPHTGSQANMAAYFGLLNPGNKIMGMSLASGGHLTHGQRVNFSGQFYHSLSYTVDPSTEYIDYEAVEDLARYHKPHALIAGASAYPRAIDFYRFYQIAYRVGCYLIADIAHISGLVAAGLHQSPVPFADCVTSSTHKTLQGPRGGIILCHKKHAKAIDKAVMPGIQGGPLMQQVAAKACLFAHAQSEDFRTYQRQILNNAKALAHALSQRGYRLVSGGTDNHLILLDLRNKDITGKVAEESLEKAGIMASRSCIPFDMEKPWITSGLRIGTPAMTTRGMQESDMETIAELIDTVLSNYDQQEMYQHVRQRVHSLCHHMPLSVY